MICIYLIRHGETDWNRERICMGQRDIPLNALGQRQAELTARRLADEPFDLIYSSDLARAFQTAQAIVQPHHLEPITRQALRELDYGDWEGLARLEIEQRWPEVREFNGRQEDSLAFQTPGGESRLELYRRATQEFEQLCHRHQDQTIALVIHGGVIRAIVNYVLSQGVQARQDEHFYTPSFACDNCGVTLVNTRRETELQIAYLNDTSHLRALAG